MIDRLRPIRVEDRVATRRSLAADLEAIGWKPDYHQSSRVGRTLEAVLGELAALAEMADANRSVPTDREGRYREMFASMPSFDPVEAERRLSEAEARLWQEYEKLAGAVRRPSKSPREKCSDCHRRERLVDTLCGPCAARILKEHRRSANIEQEESPRNADTSGGTERPT